ncbi:enoyl-CoA hydratase/isomerase family protein [Pseudomonas sp. TTU2014-080ASC]|uniref:enoyl-CoA hydratase/isomerase family protein n=1 Tax=Pseudomonas sp. TTU2014-080ASC TaxID=1729724 RepID=UPI0007183BD5|nr:enoyl-CoA hydratase-related protein [Pseudomonas sp. TTU2014-080ASC]KRW57434.1 enoyl-CoA hydratase [Pseudomonas sp. TTU2014-080ASC]
MADTFLILERSAGIAHLRLNRPQSLNALNVELACQLYEACKTLAADPELRVLVISGEGRAFMAGGDLAEMLQQPVAVAQGIIEPMHASIQLLSEMPAIVIASVHGAVAGAGLSLMMAADIAVAAEGTRFNFAYTDIGVSCDGGASWVLPRIVGLRKALEIALLAEPFVAEQALELQLISKVFPADELAQATQALAERLAGREHIALANLKRLMRSALAATQEEQLDAERDAFVDCVARPEFTQAVEGFYAARAKRK